MMNLADLLVPYVQGDVSWEDATDRVSEMFNKLCGKYSFVCNVCGEIIPPKVLVNEHGIFMWSAKSEFCSKDVCEDCFRKYFASEDVQVKDKPTAKKCNPRRTGTAYRRLKKRQKFHRRKRIIECAGCNPSAGSLAGDFIDGTWTQTGNHIKYRKNSKKQTYWKNHSNRKVRHHIGYIPKGGAYKKYFDYWWTIY